MPLQQNPFADIVNVHWPNITHVSIGIQMGRAVINNSQLEEEGDIGWGGVCDPPTVGPPQPLFYASHWLKRFEYNTPSHSSSIAIRRSNGIWGPGGEPIISGMPTAGFPMEKTFADWEWLGRTDGTVFGAVASGGAFDELDAAGPVLDSRGDPVFPFASSTPFTQVTQATFQSWGWPFIGGPVCVDDGIGQVVMAEAEHPPFGVLYTQFFEHGTTFEPIEVDFGSVVITYRDRPFIAVGLHLSGGLLTLLCVREDLA